MERWPPTAARPYVRRGGQVQWRCAPSTRTDEYAGQAVRRPRDAADGSRHRGRESSTMPSAMPRLYLQRYVDAGTSASAHVPAPGHVRQRRRLPPDHRDETTKMKERHRGQGRRRRPRGQPRQRATLAKIVCPRQRHPCTICVPTATSARPTTTKTKPRRCDAQAAPGYTLFSNKSHSDFDHRAKP